VALSPTQREIARTAWEFVSEAGNADLRNRLWQAATARFSNPLMRPFLVHTNIRQAEFALTMIASYRAQRFNPQQALVRTLLEVSAQVCWATLPEEDERREARVLQILLEGYREAKAKRHDLPAGAEELLRTVKGKDAQKVPSFADQRVALDAAERKQEGGIPHWQSHAGHYDWASKHVHPSINVALSLTDESSARGGYRALIYGFQYFALGWDGLLRLAGLEEERVAYYKHFEATKPMRDAELARLGDE
jgi:hypothetical protein